MKEIKLVEVKGRRIGGERPLICTPMVGKTEEQVIQEANEILELKPDLVEWRVDFLERVENIHYVLALLDQVKSILIDYPMIFTCRVDLEGGFRNIEQELRMTLIKGAIESGAVDILDFEMINSQEDIMAVMSAAKKNDVYVILSNHDFQKTPPTDEIVERLIKMQTLGADIAKIAVMPNSMEDVLRLLLATNIVREKHSDIPLVTMSMSGKGLISRIAGGIFGSSITFGAGKEASAPGQIAVKELHTALDLLHRNI